MSQWELRFNDTEIRKLAADYGPEQDDAAIEAGARARKLGHYVYEDFLLVCKWKTVRSKSRVRKNSPEEVAEITKIALGTSIERLRIEVLLSLYGIGLPTASVLLHLAHKDPYPIWDFRALWSLGFEKPPSESTPHWMSYVQVCRNISHANKVSMRELDRALWKHSELYQGKRS